MVRNHSRSTRRSGFTLIELLVVIAIIAILVALTSAGVMKILLKIPEVQTRTDISQMDAALAAFMSDYQLSDPPPSMLILREDMAYNTSNALELQSLQFLKRTFGKNLGPTDWNQNNQIDQNVFFGLEGEQCLVFYLGGLQTTASGTPQCLGFSTNNVNPAMVGGSRRGPYFNFTASRLMPLTSLSTPSLSPFPNGPSPFFVYLDPWQVKQFPTPPIPASYPASLRIPKPFVYFSSNGVNNSGYALNGLKDCQSMGAAPYRDAANNFTFSNKYQIISAGQDGAFLDPSLPNPGVWNPSSGASGLDGDNQANFTSRLLKAGQS